MMVVVLYNEPGEDASVEDHDVLVQAESVSTALQQLGHRTIRLGCTLDLAATRRQLLALRPDVVFNLVESLGGTDRLMALATLLLDALEIPYTGVRTNAILSTSNKLTAKARLYDAGLPTPAWMSSRECNREVPGTEISDRWILKPVLEHASFGMDDDAVVTAEDQAALEAMLRDREQIIERPLFAEQFIEGREINLSLLDGEVLPPAEIDFTSFPPDKLRIVGHQAKWDPDSFEYQQTPRRFNFAASDKSLLKYISQLAHNCWELFGLSGYARVDFRVDSESQPWILEINANPCLAPDAGFAAAVAEAGMTYEDAIQQIIESAARAAPNSVESTRR
ncbi:MAG: ATP-grasp domain-containing protein [Planctomycetaceae bacterium]|nr:ATP-grasp domain-containing protein [Planctomycetales bacterium]MCB9873260.1 ATP-grasp domain-containing protein [Planctomycetaceae bacterium]MCB9939441.1 ATP-grasp domain-containing protein [Planctomycetaceae bacterium]